MFVNSFFASFLVKRIRLPPEDYRFDFWFVCLSVIVTERGVQPTAGLECRTVSVYRYSGVDQIPDTVCRHNQAAGCKIVMAFAGRSCLVLMYINEELWPVPSFYSPSFSCVLHLVPFFAIKFGKYKIETSISLLYPQKSVVNVLKNKPVTQKYKLSMKYRTVRTPSPVIGMFRTV
jgi:hypothetical protein